MGVLEERGQVRDFVVFFLIGSPLVAYFLLIEFNSLAEATVVAYGIMISVSLLALALMVIFLLEDHGRERPVEFDRNIGMYGLALGIFIGTLVLLVNIVILSYGPAQALLAPTTTNSSSQINYQSILYVPQFFSGTPSPSNNLPVLSNAVFELFLTAPGEEAFKACFIYGLYAKTRNEIISVVFPELIWASFHTILVGFTWFEVLLATGSGIAFYIGWRKTGSLLTAIFAHGDYDAMIVIIAFVSSLGVAVYMDAVVGAIIVIMIITTFYVLKHARN